MGKCDLADGQDMQAREASPEAGGHSFLLNGGGGGGWLAWKCKLDWHEGAMDRSRGWSLTATHRERREKEEKGTANERHAGQLAGSTSKRLPHGKCAE